MLLRAFHNLSSFEVSHYRSDARIKALAYDYRTVFDTYMKPALDRIREDLARDEATNTRRAELRSKYAVHRESNTQRVAILMLTHGQGSSTIRCLDSLDHTLRGHNVELMVLDNASTDGTEGFVADLPIVMRSRIPVTVRLEDANLGVAQRQTGAGERGGRRHLPVPRQ